MMTIHLAMQILRLCLLGACLFFSATVLQAQAGNSSGCDSISRQAFTALTGEIAQAAAHHKTLTDIEATNLVKLYNTYTANAGIRKEDSLNAEQPLRKAVHAFDAYYYNIFKEKYNLKYAKGGALYLSKLDVWIGVTMTWRCRDFFWISAEK